MKVGTSSHEKDIRTGQVYADVNPPKREWRVIEEKDGLFTLVRTDDRNVIRCVEAPALRDQTRYRQIF